MSPSIFVLTLSFLGASPQSLAPEQSRPDDCEGCHASALEESVALADGTVLGVYVDPHAFDASVHGNELECTDCHRKVGPYPHEPSTYASLRDMRVTRSKTCNRCHYSMFEEVMDSMHFTQLEAGNLDAPTCVDCHGAHDVQHKGGPRVAISERCGSCHEDVQTEYAGSVHGTSLVDGSEEVPVCTDCHGVHGIEDPKSAKFHAGEHEICAKCHADEPLMAKYELSANVLDTYMDDFHGTSNALYAKVGADEGRPVATCSDCHGVHDIRSMKDREEVASMLGRTEQMCVKCHEGAAEDFAAAWLSHAEPTLEKAPLVWGIKWGYRLMIPLIMLGLVLHILMDLVQVRTHRGGRA